MYAFCLVIFPLAYLCAAAWFIPMAERGMAHRMFLRGLLLALPAVLLWALVKGLLAPVWGSAWLPVMFSLRYWMLPFGAAVGAYALSRGLRNLRRGADYKNFLAFLLGFMAVFATVFAVELWGDGHIAYTIVLPLLLLSSAAALPLPLEEAVADGMPSAVKWIAAMVGGCLLSALCLSLFFLRLEWLGLIASLCFTGGVGYLGVRRLAR